LTADSPSSTRNNSLNAGSKDPAHTTRQGAAQDGAQGADGEIAQPLTLLIRTARAAGCLSDPAGNLRRPRRSFEQRIHANADERAKSGAGGGRHDDRSAAVRLSAAQNGIAVAVDDLDAAIEEQLLPELRRLGLDLNV
jgi:hypothetical protein